MNHGGVSRSLEIDQYNDPFYMTDLTTGDFQHDGPSMSADYALRIRPKLFVGAGFDYDISTGLKDTYTKPEIVHNKFMANLGITYEPTDCVDGGSHRSSLADPEPDAIREGG